MNDILIELVHLTHGGPTADIIRPGRRVPALRSYLKLGKASILRLSRLVDKWPSETYITPRTSGFVGWNAGLKESALG